MDTTTAAAGKANSHKTLITLIVLAIIGILCYTQLTLFVIQPMGVVPEGKTLLILRGPKTQFIDSADAMCERMPGGVNILCRIGILGAVASNATVLARLPYSSWLYHISTGGADYDR